MCEALIIWAKKYYFYLGFPSLSGSKLGKVYIHVFKNKKKARRQERDVPRLHGISSLLQQYLYRPPGAGIGSHAQHLVNVQLVIY